MRGIDKSFFGVKVLKNVDFDLYPGEVHALLGENGAGKSTLIKILNGDYTKDAGTIVIEGAPVAIDSPRAAEDLGIRMIYQELHYAPELSVAENLLLGHLPARRGLLGGQVVDWRAANRIARELLQKLEIEIDPRLPMRKLSTVERQIVQIAKALSAQARILVMDEPTAALTPHEVQLLFEIIRSLRSRGVAIIYISHRLDEVFEIAQRATILRDGALVETRPVGRLTKPELVRMMVGRDIGEGWVRGAQATAATARGRAVLTVTSLAQRRTFQAISLTVHAGEIVGVFGLVGAGHVHLTRAIFGAEPVDAGTIEVEGRAIAVGSPRDGRRAGLGLVPADRKVEGLVLERSVRENVTLSNWRGLARGGFFRGDLERRHAQRWIDRLGIRMAGDMDVKIRYLSGGNQQKALLARWLEAGAKVLLLNEPTWGVDVGARFDIYELLEELAGEDLAILLVSSDIQEVLAVSHRILTIYRGRITGEFSQAEATQEILLRAAAGVNIHE
ncbi:MAG: sugar ABC transporter ATP-binding protein [Caldilineaceae bacterium]|nr:sugar ABC transporter ATP-binding protein [Caldilineaceae bacterium]